MLERFVTAKQAELANLRKAAAAGKLPAPLPGTRPDFAAGIKRPSGQARIGVIAEYKRASPSRGVIREDMDVEEVAAQYAAAGASAMSVLTEEAHFHGRLEYLARADLAIRQIPANRPLPGLPLLRKDFILDPLQVMATAATPAAALLLIVRLTPDARILRDLREQAEKFGMSAVVEIFDASDLAMARDSGARIIQVNARDLQSLSVDRSSCLALIRDNPPLDSEIWIAASGMEKAEHLEQAADAGYSTALVGTALMAGNGRPGDALVKLVSAGRTDRGEPGHAG